MLECKQVTIQRADNGKYLVELPSELVEELGVHAGDTVLAFTRFWRVNRSTELVLEPLNIAPQPKT